MFNNLNMITNDDFLGTNTKLKEFDYNSFYRAIVMSTEDSEHLGRIRINIPALHSDVTDLHAYPYAYPGCFTGLGNQVGQFILPPVGSIVFVTFEFSDEHRPIYFGGVPTTYAVNKFQSYGTHINNGQQKEVIGNDIPVEYTGSEYIIYKSPSGSIIYIDDNTYVKRVSLKDSSGQSIQMISFNDNDEIKKYTEITISDSTSILLQDDEIQIKLSGDNYKFTKESLDKLFNLINNRESSTELDE